MLGLLVQAQGRYLEVTPDSPWRYGMEVEVSGATALNRLMPYYGFSETSLRSYLVRETLTEAEVNQYLTPETFEKLPGPLKDVLSGGKSLEVKLEISEKPIEVKSSLPLAAPTIQHSSGLILPRGMGEIIIEGDSRPAASQELVIPGHVKQELQWTEITQRWKEMNREQKLRHIRLSDLAPAVKSRLILHPDLDFTKLLVVKPDAPEKIQELLKRLKLNYEGGLIELRHGTPVTSQAEYLKDLYLFSDIIGVRRYLDDPNNSFPPEGLRFTYHTHVSRYGTSLEKVAPLISKLRLLELHDHNRSAGGVYSNFGYLEDIKRKGLVKLIGDSHIESRIHTEGALQEIQTLERYMSLPPEEAVNEIRGKMNPKIKKLTQELINLAFSGSFEKNKERIALLMDMMTRMELPLDEEVFQEAFQMLSSDKKLQGITQLLRAGKFENSWRVILPVLKDNEAFQYAQLMIDRVNDSRFRQDYSNLLNALTEKLPPQEAVYVLKKNSVHVPLVNLSRLLAKDPGLKFKGLSLSFRDSQMSAATPNERQAMLKIIKLQDPALNEQIVHMFAFQSMSSLEDMALLKPFYEEYFTGLIKQVPNKENLKFLTLDLELSIPARRYSPQLIQMSEAFADFVAGLPLDQTTSEWRKVVLNHWLKQQFYSDNVRLPFWTSQARHDFLAKLMDQGGEEAKLASRVFDHLMEKPLSKALFEELSQSRPEVLSRVHRAKSSINIMDDDSCQILMKSLIK